MSKIRFGDWLKYEILADSFQELENTSSYLEKNAIIADLLKETPPDSLEMVVPMLLGRVFPAFKSRETGIGLQQLKKAVARSTGYSVEKVEDLMEDLGDLGEVARELTEKKKQRTLARETLTVEKVYENLRQLPDITGDGSVDRKIATVSELLTSASPLEAKFVVRTVLGDLRIGVAEGRLRDALAEAFEVSSDSVEHAYMLTTDYGLVAEAAAYYGEEGLSDLDLSVGHPVRPMLAQRSDSIEEILDRMGGSAAFEVKLDGIRIQPHRDDDRIHLFTRRMEDYTHMFPDLEEAIKDSLNKGTAIVDGELVAIDRDTGKPMPFQEVLRRRRKYDIERVSEEIPVHVYLFDVLLSGEKTMLDRPYSERREELERVVDPGDRIRLVDSHVTGDKDEIVDFKNGVVSQGHEGLLAKNVDSVYRAGKREFAWLKLKAEVETLDLAVVGAFAGKGDRAGTFGSYLLAAKNSETGKFETVTRVGSGFTDENLEELTEKFQVIFRQR